MTQQWRTRVLLAVGLAALVAAAGVVMGDGLEPVPFAVIAFCVTSLVWLGTDLAAATELRGVDRGRTPEAGSRHRTDLRTTRLSRRLAEIGRPGFNDESLWVDLVELADDRLLRHHDIDRRAEPARAAQALGPRLAEFVTVCPPPRQFARRSYLDAIITDIEEL